MTIPASLHNAPLWRRIRAPILLLSILWGCSGFRCSGVQPTLVDPPPGGSAPSVCEWIPARTALRQRTLETRVVHGDKVMDLGLYPSIAALETATGWQYCACTMVAPARCLTAAHCQVKSGDVVHAGTLDLRTGGVRVVVKEARHHPEWRSTTSGHDVAVLHLVADPGVPLASMADAHPAPGSSVWVVGWGSTHSGGSTVPELRHARIPIVGWASCQLLYGALDPTMLCAGNSVDGDGCQGDSGGPLFTSSPGHVTAGITSWGEGCAGRKPGVWTDVAAVRGWVEACL